jgi:hypothetical protein
MACQPICRKPQSSIGIKAEPGAIKAALLGYIRRNRPHHSLISCGYLNADKASQAASTQCPPNRVPDERIAPPMVISADNDEATAEQAATMLDGVRAELRDGDRLVIRLPKP